MLSFLRGPLLRAAALILTLAGIASATSVYYAGQQSLFIYDSINQSVLNSISLSGPLFQSGSDSVYGMSFDPNSGLLYADTTQGGFGTIDINTGASTYIGSLASTWLAFDSTGNLYGLAGESFYAINKSSGAVTNTVSIFGQFGGFAFNPATGLFESLNNFTAFVLGGGSGIGSGSGASVVGPQDFISINPISGDLNTLGLITYGDVPNFGLLNPSPIAFDSTGTAFGAATFNGGEPPINPISVDSSGAMHLLSGGDIGTNGPDASILASSYAVAVQFSTPDFAPEPSAIALLLAGAAGLFVLRKKLCARS
jgi:hypothetical protein